MRGFCGSRRSRVVSSSESRLALAVAVLAIGIAGCSRKEPGGGATEPASPAALNAGPLITNFAVYALSWL
jgi:hypothetical protein